MVERGQDWSHPSEDAVPLTVGQEWSGYGHQLRDALGAIAIRRIGSRNLPPVAPPWGRGSMRLRISARRLRPRIAKLTGLPFVTAPNKFAAQGSLDAMVASMAPPWPGGRADEVRQRHALAGLRPRCGLGELTLPANEPGAPSCPAR